MPYIPVTATHKIFSLTRRIRAVAGGTSASKTISILFWLIDYAQSTRDELITVVSESYPHLEKGAMLDFQSIMKERNYWRDDLWHENKHTYTFETGSKIEFYSVDTYSKAHGPRRDVLYVNEANNLDYKIVDQLITRTRKVVWLDWNPSEEFWFYTEMKPNRTDIDFLTVTYKDNEALDPISVAEIESHKPNKNWWRVYGEGQLGEVEGRIFTGWTIIDDVPHEARLERRGLDFGFARDPDALCDIYYYNGGYIIDELCYRVGMKDRQLADLILNQPDPNVLVIGDSADQKAIDLLSEFGVNIMGVQKVGRGNDTFTNAAIKHVQGLQVSITKRSLNYIKSYRNFMWMTNRDGAYIAKYDHNWSDGMMSVIYGLESLRPRDEKKKPVKTGNLASMWQ